MPQKLTRAVLDRVTVEGTDGRVMLFDSELPGFGVRVTQGAKTFFVQYRAGTGRTAQKRRLSLGQYGALTLDEARKLARTTLANVARGQDPARDRAAHKGAPTLAQLGAEFLEDVKARRKATTAREYSRLWEKHVVPALGSRRVQEVNGADVSRLHRSLRATPYGANRVLALLGAFFSFAERQQARERHSNPVRDVEPFTERSRERFLTASEVARLGEALTRAESSGLPAAPQSRAKGRGMSASRRAKLTGRKRRPYRTSASAPRVQVANPFAVAAIRFLLLTGWRESEALKLQWSEVDLETGRATLPDTKTGKSLRVIGAPARLLLAELPRVEGCPFVFPGRDGRRPLAELTRVWYAVRHAAQLEGVRLHDLRHSFASVSASSGGSLLVIGKLLGHHETATTARYAHLFDDPVKAAADAASSQLAAWLSQSASVTPAATALRVAK